MSTVLSIYSGNAFKRYLLPAINDADYSLYLPGEMFGLKKSVDLKLEIVDHVWYFASSDEYRLTLHNGSPCIGSALQDGDIIKLLCKGVHALSIIIQKDGDFFSVYSKYGISKLGESVTIGSGKNNDIVYDRLQLLSENHARIQLAEDGAYLEDLGSANGTFVNNRRVEGGIPLAYGDRVDIYGLRIVFLGSILAINLLESHALVNGKKLGQASLAADKIQGGRPSSGKDVFHRSPRHIAKINTEPVGIEEAPQPKELNQPSLFMTIVPSLTMALPMILGCALMIWSSNKTGGGFSSAYQYIGLITAVLSTAIGIVWAVQSQRSAKSKFEREKSLRSQKYREYISKKEGVIKEQYEHNANAMFDRYKSATECCSYGIDSTALWNRNAMQDDFLTHRVGIGDAEFQANIRIPDEKFSMIEDELMELPAKIKSQYSTLHNVPICIDVLREKLIGIIGNKSMEGAVSIAQAIIAQIAANNSYTDVKLVIVYDERQGGLDDEWGFAKWLPHVWNETRTFRYVASNKEEASEVFYELAKTIRYRIENADAGGHSGDSRYAAKPYYVIMLANPSVLEGELISKYIFAPEPVYGISTLYLAKSYEDLPNECELVIENSGQFQGIYHVTDDMDERIPVGFDPVSSSLLEGLSVRLANIEVREVQTGGDIPASLSFLDMYGVGRISELGILDRWRKNRTYESMKAMIGEKAGGTKCYLDVHEKYHGPHGLVAGTTGSGKSETLQTYILSLCINFSPKDVALFVIDYKGGGMGNLFSKLPHLIGQISNLSGNQIRRALVSIKSEKDRRQRIFNEYGVNNINSYTRLYKDGEAKTPVPHLFIIIDEFAEMKRDEPDFIQELVSVSQVGRSLGIHLIMATQKPAGTVDDNIWSNSRFKLCLRVQDRQDSMDMLHRPDAAYIVQAGRCYLQVGNDELFELFQSGWSGAPYSEDEGDIKEDVAKMLAVNGVPALEGSRTKIAVKQERKKAWIGSLIEIMDVALQDNGISLAEACGSLEKREGIVEGIFGLLGTRGIDYPDSEANVNAVNALIDLCISEGEDAEAVIQKADQLNRRIPEQPEKTQLEAVVDYLRNLAAEHDFKYDFSLFLPVLPKSLSLCDLPSPAMPLNENATFDGTSWPARKEAGPLAVTMGLFDDPENQRQDAFVLDLASAGNVAVIGSISTGKSTFLQTLIYGLTKGYSPDEVNIYAIDFSAKMLSVFEGAPHVGGIMYEDDKEKIAKFFALLSRMFSARKKLMSGGSFEQYVSIHGPGSVPAIVIVIDNYAGFLAKSGLTEQNEEFLMQLAKEGISYGFFLVASAAGFGYQELPIRMADNFRTTICLEMNDAMSYSEILRSNVKVFPEAGIKGRGVATIDSRILEYQTAVCMAAGSDYERGEMVRREMAAMASAWKGKQARPIPEIPEKPIWSEFLRLEDTVEMLRSDRYLPLGYESQYADVFGIDTSKIYTYIISGAKRKGKTNALKGLMLSASAKDSRIIVIDYASRLERQCNEVNAERITTEEQFYDFLKEFLPEFEGRYVDKKKMLNDGLEEDEIFERMCSLKRICFFVDDVASFIKKAYAKKDNPERVGDYHVLLEQILEAGSLCNMFWFVCVNKKELSEVSAYKACSLLLRDKKGIHLGGMTDDSPMNFDNLPYKARDQVLPAGCGFLPVDNEDKALQVIVPLARGGA